MVTRGSAQRPAQTFRMSWLRLYAVLAFVTTVGLFLLLLALFVCGFQNVFHTSVLSALLVGLVFELFWAVALALCNPVHLDAQGIRGFNFWGFRLAMTWAEMVSVKPTTYFGLPWLIVRSNRTKNTKNALWLPLFFADNEAFRRAVLQFAPPNSPLLPFD